MKKYNFINCKNISYEPISKYVILEKGKQLNKEKLLKKGKYPVINGGKNPSGFWNDFNFDKNLITIS